MMNGKWTQWPILKLNLQEQVWHGSSHQETGRNIIAPPLLESTAFYLASQNFGLPDHDIFRNI